MALTEKMARAHVDMWAEEKRRVDAAEARAADLEGVIRTWLAAAGPLDEVTGFHSIRTTPEFLRHAHQMVTASHIFRPVGFGGDACSICGRDIRDEAHSRIS